MLSITALQNLSIRERWLAEGGFHQPSKNGVNGSASLPENGAVTPLREANLPRVRIRVKLDQAGSPKLR